MHSITNREILNLIMMHNDHGSVQDSAFSTQLDIGTQDFNSSHQKDKAPKKQTKKSHDTRLPYGIFSALKTLNFSLNNIVQMMDP